MHTSFSKWDPPKLESVCCVCQLECPCVNNCAIVLKLKCFGVCKCSRYPVYPGNNKNNFIWWLIALNVTCVLHFIATEVSFICCALLMMLFLCVIYPFIFSAQDINITTHGWLASKKNCDFRKSSTKKGNSRLIECCLVLWYLNWVGCLYYIRNKTFRLPIRHWT